LYLQTVLSTTDNYSSFQLLAHDVSSSLSSNCVFLALMRTSRPFPYKARIQNKEFYLETVFAAVVVFALTIHPSCCDKTV
jgi:hypothetical protein